MYASWSHTAGVGALFECMPAGVTQQEWKLCLNVCQLESPSRTGSFVSPVIISVTDSFQRVSSLH